MYIPDIALSFKNSLHTVAVLSCSDLIHHTGEMKPWASTAEGSEILDTLIVSERAVGWHRFSVQVVLLNNIVTWCRTQGLTSVLEF